MRPAVHRNALVEEGAVIGDRTAVGAFSIVRRNAVVGADCEIGEGVFVDGYVVVGNRVTLKCGVRLYAGVTLEDDVVIGPDAVFSNDQHAPGKQPPEQAVPTLIRHGVSIGANATILAGLTVGMNAMIGAGAVIIRDVPPYAIVAGNPARIEGYVFSLPKKAQETPSKPASAAASSVAAVKVIELPRIIDMRGSLSVGEIGKQLPFQPKRYFLVFDVPSVEIRGEHAHKEQHQFLVCVRGSLSVMVDDGRNRDAFVLDRPNLGVHIPPMVWAAQYQYTSDAILLVLASDVYDAADYIRNYDDFLKMAADRGVH